MSTGIATLHFVGFFPAFRIWACKATDAGYSNDKADLLMGSIF